MKTTHMQEMSEEDYENLEFLLNLSQEAFDEWWGNTSEDDRSYAITIIEIARQEILEVAQSRTGDLTLAKDALSKFM